MLDPEQCWHAVQRKDARYDGLFFFGVLTTGVYCRPSCPSRPALRKNVRFYASPAEAEANCLRACKRCRPLATLGMDPNAKKMHELCNYIESHDGESLTLSRLAAKAGMSRFHFQRSFKAVIGLTPKEFVDAFRFKNLKNKLRTSTNVTEAIYKAGFGSSSRVYERADNRLGMTPKEYRKGGDKVRITYVTSRTIVGPMMVAATQRGLCFVQFSDSEEKLLALLKTEYPAARLEPMPRPFPTEFENWMLALKELLAGNQPDLEIPLDVSATAFQLRVWNFLRSIPSGKVKSYREVAAGIGQPTAARAVARACASNIVAIAIPCHRVIRGTGELGGYRWGSERKCTLIERERRVAQRQQPSSAS